MDLTLIKKNLLRKKGFLSVDLLLIFLLGFLSTTWFRGNNLIGGGDFGMPLDWSKYLKLMGFIWDETMSMGNADYRQVASLLPYALTGGLLQALGFSLIFIEKFFFYLWFTGCGLSMYYLCGVLDLKRPGRLLASIFYMLNPFSLVIIWRVSHGLIQMPYTFAPLYLGLYINGLKKRKGFKYIVAAVLIWLFTTTSSYAWPAAVVIHWVPIFLYFLWLIIFQKKRRYFILKFSFLFVLTWLLFNFYWFFPFVSSLSESMSSAQSPFLMPDLEQIKLTSVKLFEALRMLGYWSLKGGYKGEPYYPYWEYYNSPFIIAISWLIPLLVVLGFLNKKARKQPLFFFSLSLILFGLGGTSGARSPIGEYIIKFYGLFPPLALLTRFNFLFFGLPVYLIFSVLIGFSFSFIYEYGFKKIKEFVYIPLVTLAVLLNITLVLPFWTGEVIKGEGRLFPGERFKVPDYWWQAKKWLTEQKDFFRIFPLPMSKTYNVAFNWGEGYSGGDPTRWLTSQPVLNVNTGDTFKIPMLIGEAVEKQIEFQDTSKLLGLLNVRYLLLRQDSRWEFLKGHGWWFNHQPENMERFVNNQKGLSLEKTFDQLFLYRVADDYLPPRIYAPSVLTLIDGDAESLLDIAQFLQPEKREAIILTFQNKERNFIKSADFIWRPAAAPKEKDKKDLGIDHVFYQVPIRKEDNYQILLRNNQFFNFYNSNEAFKIRVDEGSLTKRTATFVGDNLISLGEIRLSKGNHIITISPPETVNLIDNPSFEENSGSFKQSTDASKGDYALKLTAVFERNIFTLPINNFKASYSYKVSFDAKHIEGYPALLILWENYTDSLDPVFDPVPSGPFGTAELETNYTLVEVSATTLWRQSRLIFTPNLFAKTGGIAFAVRPQTAKDGKTVVGKTENLFDEVKVSRVFNTPLILKPITQDHQQLTPPKISFKKLSSVKYEVAVAGATKPYLLVFSESYHPGWNLSVEADHLMMNGFANGWYIKKTGNYKIDLYFKPQRIYYLGAIVSLLTLTAAIVYIFVYLPFREKKKK